MLVTDEEDNDTDEKDDNEEDTDEEDCIWALYLPMMMGSRISTTNDDDVEIFEVNDRGEYFYLVGGAHLQVIFFSSCRNIQFGVFRADIFILWCIVQKYWSGIVTCYTAITIFYLDLTSFDQNLTRKTAFFGVRAEILLFLGLVQKYYCPELLHSGFLVQGLF